MTVPGIFTFALVAALWLAVAMPGLAEAQQSHITIDHSFGPPPTLGSGPNYTIPANFGKQVQTNLFHSFQQFNLSQGERATFTSSGSTGPISNVIGRVTGGSQSSINGTIASTITGANLYLINPSGIVFGPSATVNISGGFYASTANYLKMADGTKIPTANPDSSTFSAASPVAFGFLTPPPAAIAVNGSRLGVSSGQTLGLVAGQISINPASPPAAPTGATLSAPAGTIHVTSVAGSGEVPVNPRFASALPVTSFGRVGIQGGSTPSTLTVSNANVLGNGGSVFIRCGALTIDFGTVAANNSNSGPGGQLALYGDGQITLRNGASVQAVATGSGSGAAVTLSTAAAGTIGVDGARTLLTFGSAGSGNGGAISVQTGRLTLSNGGALTSVAQASGDGSPIAINAETIVADGGSAFNFSTGIFSTTSSTASNAGGGGAISIVSGELALHNGANVLAGSCAARTCLASGALPPAGIGGAVAVSAGSLTIDSAASLGTFARGTGTAGDVSVTAVGPVTIDRGPITSILAGIGSETGGGGNAGKVALRAGALTLSNDGLVASVTLPGATGNSGNVSVDVTGPLSITGVSSGITGSSFSSGKGGNVTVTAGSITIDSSGSISSQAGSSGDGGGVTVMAGSLKIASSGEITASTFGRGASGSVSVSVAGELAIDGAATRPGLFTGIFSQANQGSAGNAGRVSVDAGSISIVNNGTISGSTSGSGNGGSVAVSANSISLANLGKILSTTSGTGSAGQISVAAGILSIASNGQIQSAAATGSSGQGGNIVVSVAGQLLIDGTSGDQTSLTGISTQSQGRGDGGRVLVTAGSLSINHTGQISSSNFARGKGGTVAVAVDGLLSIDGSGTNPDVVATGIVTDSRAGSSGNAGDVSVQAGALSMINGGSISSALRPFMNLPASTGNSGSVAVNIGGLLSLSGSGSRIGTETSAGSRGNAGSITVNAGQIALANGGQIISTTAGTGAGGSVTVATPGMLVLDGMGNKSTQIATSATDLQSGPGGTVTVQASGLTVEGGAQIASSTAGPGRGGDVNITVASDIMLPDPGPQISALSTGNGDAGTITVSAVRLLMNDGSQISTDALGERSVANGGNINLHIRDFLYLASSEISTSVRGFTGNGGNITIDPQLVILDHSIIKADAIAGHGGNIMITAGQFLPSSDSRVEATSEFGVQGTVTINGIVNANGALAVLSTQLRSRVEILREACESRGGQPLSSLVEAGRGGLPQNPEATLPALYIAGRDLTPNPPIAPGTTEASSNPVQTTARLTMRCG